MGTDLARTASIAASSAVSPRSRGLKRQLMVVGVIASFGTACTGETAVPIDLNSTTIPTIESSTIPDGLDPANPNEDQNRVAVGYAEQQCRDDPELEEGYVRIVVPDTEEIVGEITVDCEQVRSTAIGSE